MSLHRRFAYLPICVVVSLASELASCQAQSGTPASATSRGEIKRRLLEAADQVETPRFSLRAAASPESVEVSHQIEAFAKEIQVAWLKRGLDDNPQPADVSARLTPDGVAHRKKFVSSLEELANLTLSEPTPPRPSARKDRPSTSGAGARKNSPAPKSAPPPDGREKTEAFKDNLVSFARTPFNRFNPISYDAAIKRFQVSPEQMDLILKLDELNKAALMAWARKNIDPSTDIDDASGQPSQVRRSSIGISNRVIFTAILRLDQVESLRSAMWREQGPACLLDPELASLLGINKEQREMVRDALRQGEEARKDFVSKNIHIYQGTTDPLEKKKFSEMLKQYRDDANQVVWDQLTPAQLSKLSGLLGEKVAKSKPQPKGASSRPSPRS